MPADTPPPLSPDPRLADLLQQTLGVRPRGLEPMAGATSADLYRVHLADDTVVLRRFRTARWEHPAEALVARELHVLKALESTALATPRPIGQLPENGVLMSCLPGTVELPRAPTSVWIDELAAILSRIHGAGVTVDPVYASWNDTKTEGQPDWWQDTALWEAAHAQLQTQPAWTPCFIHRDYHPVNVLWEADRISGIVDWINACMGPVGVDVAHCRINLALMYGQPVAEQFLTSYTRQNPDYVHDGYWDLDDAFSGLPDIAPYPPWKTFGLGGLTKELVRERFLAFVAAAVKDRPAP